MVIFDSEDFVQDSKMYGLLSVSIIYKHSNTVFFKCRLISDGKSGSADRECWYLNLCNATVRFRTVLKC